MSSEDKCREFEAVCEKHLMDTFEREVQVLLLLKFIASKCDIDEFTAFCIKEAKGDQTEEWINCIRAAMSQLPELDVSRLPLPADPFVEIDKEEEASRIEYLYEYASAIVEPDGSNQDYYDFVESDAWVQFILTHFGADWAKVAQYVEDNGY